LYEKIVTFARKKHVMGLLQTLKGLFFKPEQKAQSTQAPYRMPPNRVLEAVQRFSVNNYGKIDSRVDAAQLIESSYARNSDVYAVVNMIVKASLSVPKILFQVSDQAAFSQAKARRAEIERRYAALAKSRVSLPLKPFLKEQEITEVESHLLLDTIENPNPNTSGIELEEFSLAMLLICGNAYEYGLSPRNGSNKGAIRQIWNVYPQQVKIVEKKGTIVGEYEILYRDVLIPKEEIMHMKLFNPLWDGNGSQLFGMSPLYAGRFLLSLSNAGFENLWENSDTRGLRGFFSPERFEQGINGLTETQAKQLKDTFNLMHRNGGDPFHVTSVPLKWQKVGDTMVEMQAIETQMYTKRAICDLYNVSSALFNDAAGTTFNNMSEARKALYTNAAIPLLVRYDQARQNWLVKSHGTDLRMERDYSAIHELQPDKTALMQVVNQTGFLTPNEKRDLFDYERYEDEAADKLYQDSSVVPLGEVETAIEKVQKTLWE
jgi:HK97 family phage portal protein